MSWSTGGEVGVNAQPLQGAHDAERHRRQSDGLPRQGYQEGLRETEVICCSLSLKMSRSCGSEYGKTRKSS